MCLYGIWFCRTPVLIWILPQCCCLKSVLEIVQSDWILWLHANSQGHGNYHWCLGRMGSWLIVRSGYSVELICYCSLGVLRLDQGCKSRMQAWLFPRSETVLCGVAFLDPQMSLAKWPPRVWVSWIQQKQRAGVVQDVLHSQAHQCIFSTFGSICKVCSLKEEKYWEFVITVWNLNKTGTFDLNNLLCKDFFTHWPACFSISYHRKHRTIKASLPTWKNSAEVMVIPLTH